MSKIKDVVHKIEEEAEEIANDAKKVNAELDAAVDQGLEKVERSSWTGVWALLALLFLVAIVGWAIVSN